MNIGIVIPSDETQEPYERPLTELEDYQAVVGGFIEPVPVGNAKLTIFCNEEGKLRRLPLNRRATALWWLLDPVAREVDQLVGDIVVLGTRGVRGATTDAPLEFRHLILEAKVFRSEIRIFDRLGWHRTELQFNSYFDAAINALLYFRSDDAVSDVRVVEG